MRNTVCPRVLVVGIGNPGRQDDGLGPLIVDQVEREFGSKLTAEVDYQLSIEHAEALSKHDRVLFVDADTKAPEPFRARRLAPSADIAFTSHLMAPESVLALCEEAFQSVPETVLVGVRGYEYGISEGLTPGAASNSDKALDYIRLLIRNWKGENMAAGDLGKTILIIDDDPDIRASTRIVLESAGFSVGEAADGEEGMKIATRIQPDAILMDLMMETVDAGSKASSQLKASGFEGPIYLLSAAGDAVRYNIDAKELGLAGIFQKPIDHNVLLTTLKTKLQVK